jgi:hypothetical protein
VIGNTDDAWSALGEAAALEVIAWAIEADRLTGVLL